jgi:hypothetical protein
VKLEAFPIRNDLYKLTQVSSWSLGWFLRCFPLLPCHVSSPWGPSFVLLGFALFLQTSSQFFWSWCLTFPISSEDVIVMAVVSCWCDMACFSEVMWGFYLLTFYLTENLPNYASDCIFPAHQYEMSHLLGNRLGVGKTKVTSDRRRGWQVWDNEASAKDLFVG